MSGGRPSKYKPEFAEQAKQLTDLGATDRELAVFFKVAESTLNLWKLEHHEFSESLKLGKEMADRRVEQSLYHRARGYSHEAVKILMTKDGDVYREEYVEHYPPDTTACIFWLKNRQPQLWRDKQEVEHTGLTGAEALAKARARVSEWIEPVLNGNGEAREH